MKTKTQLTKNQVLLLKEGDNITLDIDGVQRDVKVFGLAKNDKYMSIRLFDETKVSKGKKYVVHTGDISKTAILGKSSGIFNIKLGKTMSDDGVITSKVYTSGTNYTNITRFYN